MEEQLWEGQYDERLVVLFQSLSRGLKFLNLHFCRFGSDCARVLLTGQGQNGQYHRDILEGLSISSSDLKESLVHQLLCSFPKLRWIHCSLLTDFDVLTELRPWFCLDLRIFHICLALKCLARENNNAVVVEALSQVAVADAGPPSSTAPPYPSLPPAPYETISERTT